MEEDQTILPVSVATLWFVLSGVRNQEPGLVKMIERFVQCAGQFTLVGFAQSHKDEYDMDCSLESSETRLRVFFSSGLQEITFRVISCYKSHANDGYSCGEHEVIAFSLNFGTELPDPDDFVKASDKQPLLLHAPKEVESHFKKGRKKFELCHGLQVKPKKGEQNPFFGVIVDELGDFYTHCFKEMEGSVDLYPPYVYGGREDTYVPKV
jgi:hypothetical protein